MFSIFLFCIFYLCFCWWLVAGLGVTDFQVGDERMVVCTGAVVLVVAFLVVVNAVVIILVKGRCSRGGGSDG